MKTVTVEGPDGNKYAVTVPENASKEEILAAAIKVYQASNPNYAPMGAPGDREPPAASAAPPPAAPPAPPQPRVIPPQAASGVDPRSVEGGTTREMYNIVPEKFAYGEPPVRDQVLEALMVASNRNRELNPDFGGPVVDVLGGTAGALASKFFAGKTPTALEQFSANRAAFDRILQDLQTSPLNAVAPSQSQMPGTEVRMRRGEPTLPGFVPRQSASATPALGGGTPGEKWAEKVVGNEFVKPGVQSVTEAAADYRRQKPQGKTARKLPEMFNLPHGEGSIVDRVIARQQAAEQAAQQQSQAAQQQANRDQQLAEERFRQATRSAQGIAPAPGTYRGALQRYPGLVGGLAGAGGTELMQQALQYQEQGDPVGAGIAGALSVGTTAGIFPSPITRAVGMGTGAISPLVLYLYDKMRNRGSVMDGR